MKKIYLLAIVLFSVALLILFVLYNRYASSYAEEGTYRYISRNIDILNENLDFERRYALSLSLFISKNGRIRQALQENNQSMAIGEMAHFLAEIKEATGISNIDIQVHTKALKAFARSWESGHYFGTALGGFRKGLVRVRERLEPFVSIELGKRLNIKAISPILDKAGHYIGSIEVIMGFANIKKRLRAFDLDILGLLDKTYLDIAVDLRSHASVGQYVVVEQHYPQDLYRILKSHPEMLSEKRAYFSVGERIIVLIPMLSVGIEDVGMIALSMQASHDAIPQDRSGQIAVQNRTYQFNNKAREVTIK